MHILLNNDLFSIYRVKFLPNCRIISDWYSGKFPEIWGDKKTFFNLNKSLSALSGSFSKSNILSSSYYGWSDLFSYYLSTLAIHVTVYYSSKLIISQFWSN